MIDSTNVGETAYLASVDRLCLTTLANKVGMSHYKCGSLFEASKSCKHTYAYVSLQARLDRNYMGCLTKACEVFFWGLVRNMGVKYVGIL